MATKYLDYAGLQRLVENIDKKYAPIAALIFQGSVEDIAHLPALNTQKVGWMYNVEVGGGTTSDFVEGPGHVLGDGENVAVVEFITGYSKIASPAATDDPKALGWYEEDTVSFVDVTADLDPSADPAALGLYEEDSLNPGQYIPTADTTIQSGKAYYERVATYVLSADRIPVSGKDYFEATTVKKWDILGGVFDLENRYLEFGQEFPRDTRVVDGRTFLYMGDDTKVYTLVASPSGRPADEGYFEGTFTPVADPTTIFNPKQQGLYEEITPSTTPATYVLSSDVTYDNTKTYYEGAFVASADVTVDPAKVYYTEAAQYSKGTIYEYDSTAQDWIAQSSGASDMIPITTAELDDLFI